MEALCLLKKGDTAYLRERISRDREKIKVLRTKRVLMHRKYSGKISALEHKVLRNMKTILVFHTSEAVRSDSQTSGPLSLEERRSLEHENDQIQLKLAHKYLQDLELHIAAKHQVH